MELTPDAKEPAQAAALPEPPARSSWFRREAVSIGDVAVQIFAVVLGILLALSIDDWKKEHDKHLRVAAALKSLRGEIETNRAELAKTLKLISEGDAEMAREVPSAGAAALPCNEYKSWHGLPIPLLLDTSYQAAIATQAMAQMEFTQAQQVALVYARQRQIQETIATTIATLSQRRPAPLEECRQMLAGEQKHRLEIIDAGYAEFLKNTASAPQR